MEIRFYGTRGSLPVATNDAQIKTLLHEAVSSALRQGIKESEIDTFLENHPLLPSHAYGGNTSCVALFFGEETLVLDAGSGMRELGLDLMSRGSFFVDKPMHLLLSHVHWDHLCGFPFFVPAYIAGNRITVSSGHAKTKQAMSTQMKKPFFPVPFETLSADIEFSKISSRAEATLGSAKVTTLPLRHPDGCYGYRIVTPSGVLVYMTDTEIPGLKKSEMEKYRKFVQDADVVIADSQYTFRENYQKLSWGHSSVVSFIDICRDCNVSKLVMFHHDPTSSDIKIDEMLESAQNYQKVNAKGDSLEILAAYDGMIINV